MNNYNNKLKPIRKIWIFHTSICYNNKNELIAYGGGQRIANLLFIHLSKSMPCDLVCLTSNRVNTKSLLPFVNNHCLKYLLLPYALVRYIERVQKEKPQIIISMSHVTNIINQLLGCFLKTEVVLAIHAMPSLDDCGKFIRVLTRIIYSIAKKKNTRFIAISNGVKHELQEIYGINEKNIKILYNPIDTNVISTLSLSIDNTIQGIIESKLPIIMTGGRLEKVKCYQHLIRSFSVLVKKHPARLIICGTGSEEPYLKELVAKLSLEHYVSFLGWQENIYKYMAHSTVFVLSSISEGLPNVLIEAMASGCPVISANCSPGICEIIGENCEYGLLTEPMTGIRHQFDEALDSGEESLLMQMRRILDDNKLREEYVKRGKERAAFFSLERRIKEYDEFIQELMIEKKILS